MAQCRARPRKCSAARRMPRSAMPRISTPITSIRGGATSSTRSQVGGATYLLPLAGLLGHGSALLRAMRGREPDPLRLRDTALVEPPANPLPGLLDEGVAMRTITRDSVARAAPSPRRTCHHPPSSPARASTSCSSPPAIRPQALVDKARSLCPGGRYCRVQGWSERSDIPANCPCPSPRVAACASASPRPMPNGGEAVFFDCRLFPRAAESEPAARRPLQGFVCAFCSRAKSCFRNAFGRETE